MPTSGHSILTNSSLNHIPTTNTRQMSLCLRSKVSSLESNNAVPNTEQNNINDDSNFESWSPCQQNKDLLVSPWQLGMDLASPWQLGMNLASPWQIDTNHTQDRVIKLYDDENNSDFQDASLPWQQKTLNTKECPVADDCVNISNYYTDNVKWSQVSSQQLSPWQPVLSNKELFADVHFNESDKVCFTKSSLPRHSGIIVGKKHCSKDDHSVLNTPLTENDDITPVTNCKPKPKEEIQLPQNCFIGNKRPKKTSSSTSVTQTIQGDSVPSVAPGCGQILLSCSVTNNLHIKQQSYHASSRCHGNQCLTESNSLKLSPTNKYHDVLTSKSICFVLGDPRIEDVEHIVKRPRDFKLGLWDDDEINNNTTL